MKLYLTLEDGDLKSERILHLNENNVTNHDWLGTTIEGMFDQINKKNIEEMNLEARRLTVHND